MQQSDIHNYLIRFFQASGCTLKENIPNRKMSVALSIDMDKELMNRPFYWHYLEKTGGTPAPMQLTFFTDPNEGKQEKGERIHFGSPRLHQLFRSARKHGAHICLYESIRPVSGSVPLFPWLCMNVRISYHCHRKKDEILSFGINLINGQMIHSFMDQMFEKEFVTQIPDLCFTMKPLFKPQNGVNRIKEYILKELQKQKHEWAADAYRRMEEDLQLLERFYKEDEKPTSYHIEKEAIQNQYAPRIYIEPINGGLFYLRNRLFT